MSNAETSVARRFHNATKYTMGPGPDGETTILMGTPPDLGPAIGEQNPEIEPFPFKVYTSLDPIPLPREPRSIGLTALDALAATGDLDVETAIPDLATVAHLLLRSNGVLKTWTSPWGRTITFRAAGCTGARYHLELYLVCGALPGLAAGVYHYSAQDHSLRLLRAGDFRSVIVSATGEEPSVAAAPAIAIASSTFWRNAWRYQERAYRHVYWDTGTLLTSLLPVAADAGLSAKVVLGFADNKVNSLLDIDDDREAAIALVAIGCTADRAGDAPPVTPLNLPTQAISAREIDFPLIREMHHASSLATGADAAAWRSRPLTRTRSGPSGEPIALPAIASAALPADAIDTVIQRRRSNRHYDTAIPLPLPALATVLDRASRGTSLDALAPGSDSFFDVYLIVNNVDGLEPGSYVYHPGPHTLERLSGGDQRAAAMHLACDQEYAADAHVNVYTLTDLEPLLERFGNRGYRLAQLEAALFAGRVQLAAHALGLGAVGSTSVDDEVTDHFSPHAAGKSFMFVAVFGPRRKASTSESDASTSFLRQ
ncbi:MAG: SagB/ThcOx family dehydrogenase [Thermomicrobiales bacterium]|nr:SagB/ThcOx family dehydrogenase [Thermomicrobiales bacterium]